MVVSDGDLVLIKAIDGSVEFKDKHYIAGLLKDAIKEIGQDRKSTRLNSSHERRSRMPSSA